MPLNRHGVAARRSPFRLFRTPLRVLILTLVVAFAAVLVVPTLREQLSHEQQLDELRQQVAAAKQHEEDLNAELKRWDDPAYVRSQARTRLGYGKPGEKAYRVLEPEEQPTDAPGPTVSPTPTPEPDSELPWYLRLVESLDPSK